MIKKDPETLIVVLHEIYGINNHIIGVCRSFATEEYAVISPNMLQINLHYKYGDEPVAYLNFMQNVGFKEAYQKVINAVSPLRKMYKHCFVVGYSIGATVAWLCSQNTGLFDGVIGFYGSRIRDYMDIRPQCPVLLFLPSSEPSFDINCFIQEIEQKSNVHLVRVNALHGFANPESKDYSREVYTKSFDCSLQFINNCISGIVGLVGSCTDQN